METYLFVVIVLLIIAAVDLMVGVANDAVNFLSSAVGARAGSLKLILVIAAAGVFFGVTFSSGMMEIARKGVIHPEYFQIAELMAIFFAVMITDVILLDVFNTFGLPTSTTVSIVSELFGAGVALSLIKITQEGQDFGSIIEYINTSKILAIYTGILLSIVVAFIVGAIVQFFSRLLFTFDYKSRIKKYGAVWASFALTMISYFILIKGAKGASFITDETTEWINANTWLILGGSFVFWTLLLHLWIQFTKINILKFVVLAGTFALAMAFAANDLVNFIGVPLAALSTYNIALGSTDPLTATMEALKQPVQANTLILLAAGTIMVVTLFLSRKARSVTKTTLLLGRQDEGYERFESLPASRAIVRMVLFVSDFIKSLLPESVRRKISERLDVSKYQPEAVKKGEDPASFDLVRAGVNLMVAAALISFGTSLKLPLSTTYVTFIVAMATALPDKAWGRESAVFRVSGVLTVVGGWIFTALIASSVGFAVAYAVYYGGLPVVIGFIILASFSLYRANKIYKQRTERQLQEELMQMDIYETPDLLIKDIFGKISGAIMKMNKLFNDNFSGLFKYNLNDIIRVNKESKKMLHNVDISIQEILNLLRITQTGDLDFGHKYGQIFGSMHDMALSIENISSQCRIFIDNNHKPFIEDEKEELLDLVGQANKIYKATGKSLNSLEFCDAADLAQLEKELSVKMQKYLKKQIKRVSKYSKNNKRSILFINLLEATRNISRNAVVISMLCCDILKDIRDEEELAAQKILPD